MGSGTEAFAVDRALSQEFRRTGANHYLLFRDLTGELLATNPAFVAAVDAAVAPVRDDPAIASVLTYGSSRNTAVDAAGLEATGKVVTSAALIMVVVFDAFASGRVLLVQRPGVGLALAVALDATHVRAILVPATMRLLGKWNWWAPSWAWR